MNIFSFFYIFFFFIHYIFNIYAFIHYFHLLIIKRFPLAWHCIKLQKRPIGNIFSPEGSLYCLPISFFILVSLFRFAAQYFLSLLLYYFFLLWK